MSTSEPTATPQSERAANRRRLESSGVAWADELGCDRDAFGVGSNLHWAMTAFQARLERAELQRLQLSLSEFVTLWSVFLSERTPSTTLAAEVGLAPSSMTGLLKRLEERGLVERRRDPDDGRAILVSLTEDGRERAAEAFQAVNSAAVAMTTRLTTAEKHQLASMLRVLTHDLESDFG